MNKKAQPTLAAVFALSVMVGSTIANSPASELATIRLTTAPQNAGKIAQATLVSVGDATQIALFVSGVPSNVAQPPNLYTYIYPGACGRLGPKPAFAMNQRVLIDYPTYHSIQLRKMVPIKLGELRAGDYALVVRTSPADGAVDIFCGSLKQAT